jgi:hypothetical protein
MEATPVAPVFVLARIKSELGLDLLDKSLRVVSFVIDMSAIREHL